MIKQILSKDLKKYLKNNPKSILLDVRTEEEWSSDGKPNGEVIGLKTYFLTIKFSDGSFNQNFTSDFNKLNIENDYEILTMCMGGMRSQVAADILVKENYICSNISDGFLGNNKNAGWKKNGYPCK
jgi:rhodanese-related sulfurtransferase